MKLQITDIDRNLNEKDLKKIFAKFGPITECTIVLDQVTGKSKGFGFVTLASEEMAQKAVSELNGRVVNGQKIKVKHSRN